MSTPSFIGQELTNGQIRFVYCHCDGHPDGNGLVLLEHYNYKAKTKLLLDVGAISALRANIGKKHKPAFGEMYAKSPEIVNQWTTFSGRDYSSDMSEGDLAAGTLALDQFDIIARNAGCQFAYVLRRTGDWVWVPAIMGRDEEGYADFSVDAFPGSLKEWRPLNRETIITWIRDESNYRDECIPDCIISAQKDLDRIEGIAQVS